MKIRNFAMLALALTLGTGMAWADHGKGNGSRDGDHSGRNARWTDHDTHRNRDARSGDRDHDDWRRTAARRDRDGRRDRDDDRRGNSWRGSSNVPPGWSHGRKTGWGGCDVPPGQAKKSGCSNSTWAPRGDRDGWLNRDSRRHSDDYWRRSGWRGDGDRDSPDRGRTVRTSPNTPVYNGQPGPMYPATSTNGGWQNGSYPPAPAPRPIFGRH